MPTSKAGPNHPPRHEEKAQLDEIVERHRQQIAGAELPGPNHSEKPENQFNGHERAHMEFEQVRSGPLGKGISQAGKKRPE